MLCNYVYAVSFEDIGTDGSSTLSYMSVWTDPMDALIECAESVDEYIPREELRLFVEPIHLDKSFFGLSRAERLEYEALWCALDALVEFNLYTPIER